MEEKYFLFMIKNKMKVQIGNQFLDFTNCFLYPKATDMFVFLFGCINTKYSKPSFVVVDYLLTHSP